MRRTVPMLSALINTSCLYRHLSTTIEVEPEFLQDCGGSADQPRRKVGQTAVGAAEPEIRTGEAGAEQPVVEFGRPLQSEQGANVERVVERGRLVVQHDVVGAGHAHDKTD